MVSDPCPEDRIGCLVHHFHYECDQIIAFTVKDSALNFIEENKDSYLFGPRLTLDSMILVEFINKLNN